MSPQKLLLCLLLTCGVSEARAAVISVQQNYHGFVRSYAHFPDNDIYVDATFDDSSVTGVGTELIGLDSITLEFVGNDVWVQGVHSFGANSGYSAAFENGIFRGLIGDRDFGAVNVFFWGTYLQELRLAVRYHSHQVFGLATRTTGPVTPVPVPGAFILLVGGLGWLAGSYRQRSRSI